MRPIAQIRTEVNPCLVCHQTQRQIRLDDPVDTAVFFIALPMNPTEHESIQSLIDAHFTQREYIDCSNPPCNARVGRTVSHSILDTKSAFE